MMGEPSGSSRREARTREERQTGKRCRSRKALDPDRPNREEPNFILGRAKKLRVQIDRQPPESDWAREVRRVRSPLAQDATATSAADAGWTTLR
jgi:hypothetical protein